MSIFNPAFVIQKHNASQLHYDFRLEVDGVLKSWVVPKGPSTDPTEKRLALEVEDHELSAVDFEGRIKEEEYGGGTILIWDRGRYDNLKENTDMKKAYREGHIEVWLHGEKLTGGYALVRIRSEDQPEWLLVKMKDEESDARRNPVSTQPESVKTGRNLKEIHSDEDLVSLSNN